MKKLLYPIALLSICTAVNAQRTLDNVRTTLDNNFNDPTITNQKIVSDKGLNAFFGKKVAYYLSGSQELSLFKTYFILDSDGELSLAYNIAPETEGRITDLHTVGLKAKIEDGFGAFFKGNETQGDIGFTYRYTHFFGGTLNFDNFVQRQKGRGVAGASYPQWNKMRDRRKTILNTLQAKLDEEETAFNSSLAGVNNTAEIISDFQGEKLSAFQKEQAELEADALIDNRDLYNSIHKAWLSVDFYIPITPSKYIVAPDFVTETKTAYYYPAEATLSLNTFWEAKHGKLFFSVGVGAKYNSSISAEMDGIEEIETTDYKNLGGADTLKLANVGSKKMYIGEYESFLTAALMFQLILFPDCLSGDKVSAGLSGLCEINAGKYDPLNLKFGLPIRLDADEDGQPVNIEIRGEFFDFNGAVTDSPPKDNFSLGVGVGLPFNSLIK